MTTNGPERASSVSGGRIALVVIGVLMMLFGLGAASGGGVLLWIDRTQRDADGFFAGSTDRYASGGYAITSEAIDLGSGGGAGWAADLGDLARVRVRGEGAPGGPPLFIGIGPRDAVEGYLAGVRRSEVDDVDFDPFVAHYADVPGTRAPSPPGREALWVARAEGTGPQSLEWDMRSGTWMLVVMNATAAPGVAADLAFGVKVGVLLPIAVGLLVVGLLVLGAGVTMFVFGLRAAGRTPRAPDAHAAGGPADPGGAA